MTNKTIADILNDMIPDGLVVDKLTDEPNTAATALLKQFKATKVDQALKEISELLLDCKPEKPIYDNRRSPKTTGKTHGTKDFVIGYSAGVDDYEKNLKARLQ